MGQQQSFSFEKENLESPSYERRRPENGVLHKIVRENMNTFFELCEQEGKRIPSYVKKEFEAFLECGVLANGFVRFKCEDCSHEKIVAFSCKKRGFCPSCGGKRMAETAAHLVDSVFPKGVGIRQYVLSFPFPIRFILARESKVQSSCLKIIQRAISGLLRKKAKAKGLKGDIQTGSVTLIQRFGGSINLNVHFHMLFIEGVYVVSSKGPKFHKVDEPTDSEIQELVQTIAKRVVRHLIRHGYLDEHQGTVSSEENDHEQEQEELMPELQAASIQSKVALGQRKGEKVRKLGVTAIEEDFPTLSGSQCAQIQGFSLHAAIYCKPWERNTSRAGAREAGMLFQACAEAGREGKDLKSFAVM